MSSFMFHQLVMYVTAKLALPRLIAVLYGSLLVKSSNLCLVSKMILDVILISINLQ